VLRHGQPHLAEADDSNFAYCAHRADEYSFRLQEDSSMKKLLIALLAHCRWFHSPSNGRPSR
jgi:hypothetical protein